MSKANADPYFTLKPTFTFYTFVYIFLVLSYLIVLTNYYVLSHICSLFQLLFTHIVVLQRTLPVAHIIIKQINQYIT